MPDLRFNVMGGDSDRPIGKPHHVSIKRRPFHMKQMGRIIGCQQFSHCLAHVMAAVRHHHIGIGKRDIAQEIPGKRQALFV